MVSAYRRARLNPLSIAEAVLSLLPIENPSERQQVGALAVGEFLVNINRFVGGK